MITIPNGFGGTDEQAMIDQFYELHGQNVAEELDRLLKNSYPVIRYGSLKPVS